MSSSFWGGGSPGLGVVESALGTSPLPIKRHCGDCPALC